VNQAKDRGIRLGVLGVAMGLAATACSGGGSAPTTPGSIVLAAATKTAGTASFQISGQYRTVETARPSVVEEEGTITGAMDVAHGRSRVTTTDTTSAGVSGQPGGSALPSSTSVPPAPDPAATTTVIKIGKDMWMSGGGGLLSEPADSWLLVPLSAHQAASQGGLLGDPTQMFAQLKTRLTGVTLIGHQLVGGAATSRYQGRDLWLFPKGSLSSPASGQVVVNV
jgi:hypothetical protein